MSALPELAIIPMDEREKAALRQARELLERFGYVPVKRDKIMRLGAQQVFSWDEFDRRVSGRNGASEAELKRYAMDTMGSAIGAEIAKAAFWRIEDINEGWAKGWRGTVSLIRERDPAPWEAGGY